jgi:hypothetical protein
LTLTTDAPTPHHSPCPTTITGNTAVDTSEARFF